MSEKVEIAENTQKVLQFIRVDVQVFVDGLPPIGSSSIGEISLEHAFSGYLDRFFSAMKMTLNMNARINFGGAS